jgi:hypothetical protein
MGSALSWGRLLDIYYQDVCLHVPEAADLDVY